MLLTIEHLRGFAITRSLFRPTTLKRAIHKRAAVMLQEALPSAHETQGLY